MTEQEQDSGPYNDEQLIEWRFLNFLSVLICAVFASALVIPPLYRSFPALVVGSIALYTWALHLLSLAADYKYNIVTSKTENPEQELDDLALGGTVFFTRTAGAVASIALLAIPYSYLKHHGEDPIINVCLRVSCFFLACKLLDLTVARAHKPPLRKEGQSVLAINSHGRRAEYIWLLMTETRYRAFDNAVQEPRRLPSERSVLWAYGPLVVFPLLVYLFPVAETKVLFCLMCIQLGLEGVHTLFHPFCPHYLFWQPFAATTIARFWGVHWHQGAAPFLKSIGYDPAYLAFSKLGGHRAGRLAGVLATFSLSGIWHAWCAAALSTRPWRGSVSLWLLFMSHGIGCLLERAIWRRQGGIVQRIVCWVVLIELAAVWLRDVLPTSRIPWFTGNE